jgi:hypothetical protein
VIAEFDSTENDQARVTIKGFPTIYLFPADHKVSRPFTTTATTTTGAWPLLIHRSCLNPG